MIVAVTAPADRRLSEDEIAAAALDPVRFVDAHCVLRTEKGLPAPFRLWDFQRRVLERFDDHDRVIVLKARQLGLSWLADAYALWLCAFNEGQTVLMLSMGQREAAEELARVRYMHARLPVELRRPTGAPDRFDRVEFPTLDSRIISLPATEDAGTGYTATLVVVQELAKIEVAEQMMTALLPTISAGGKLLAIGTAKGYGGVFYELWREAEHRLDVDDVQPGEFRPVFIPWFDHPHRDEAWYAAQGRGMSQRALRQEFPANPGEAFQLVGDACFAEDFVHAPAPDGHLVDGTREPRSPCPVYRGIDFGHHHAPCLWIEVQGGRTAFVFAELHMERATVGELADAVVGQDGALGLRTAEIVAYCDPAGLGTNLQTGESDIAVLERHGITVGNDGERYGPGERVDLIKTLLRNGRLFVSYDCPYLIAALEQAQWARAGRTGPLKEMYAKDGVWDHPLDALGEALARIFPAEGPAAALDVLTPAATMYSGSQYG